MCVHGNASLMMLCVMCVYVRVCVFMCVWDGCLLCHLSIYLNSLQILQSKHTHTLILVSAGRGINQCKLNCVCVCLFGSVKAGDLGWFMTQKQRLHFTQKEEKSDFFFFFFNSQWSCSEPVCSVKFTRPDLIPAIIFTVWEQLQARKMCPGRATPLRGLCVCKNRGNMEPI